MICEAAKPEAVHAELRMARANSPSLEKDLRIVTDSAVSPCRSEAGLALAPPPEPAANGRLQANGGGANSWFV